MRTGKHGHCKTSIIAVDIFTKKKYEHSQPTANNVDKTDEIRNDIILPKETTDDQNRSKEIKLALSEGRKLKVILIIDGYK